MTPQEKIDYVRKLIDDKVQISPKGAIFIRLYTLTEYEEGPVLLYRSEQKSILQKLEEEGHIENLTFSEDETGAWLAVTSEKQEELIEPPIIRTQTLELISQHFADLGSLSKISNYLLEWGVPRRLITLGTKWRMVYAVLQHYANPKTQNGREMLYKIIGNILHPLMYGGDKYASEEAQDKFNKYLEYDGLVVVSDGKNEFSVREIKDLIEVDENELLQEFHEDLFIQEQAELTDMRLPENKEKMSTLRKAYKVLMNITEIFCENPSKPSHELNDAYVEIKKLITDNVRDLHLYVDSVNGVQRIHKLTHYFIPFNNLFSAEKEYSSNSDDKNLERILDWNFLRPKMHATYGEIDELYRKVEGSEILSKPNVQQTLNDVSLLLSKTKEENKKALELRQSKPIKTGNDKIIDALDETIIKGLKSLSFVSQKPKQDKPQQIEIVNKELLIKNADESVVVKGKNRIHLPQFKSTDWAKITIQFVDEQNVVITADKKQTVADYKSLGFEDGKKKKPDTTWKMLLGLARNNGKTEKLTSPIPETIRQQKSKLSNRLKAIFKNDNDPFDDVKTENIYRLKIKLIPPQSDVPEDKIGVKTYLEETMTEKYEREP